MTNTIKSGAVICAEPSTFSATTLSDSTSQAIASLANSKTCGLAILVDKLLVGGTVNASTKHLINNLINRFHRHSIEVAITSQDDPENYISTIVAKAMQYTSAENLNRSSVDTSAKLLARAITEFESNQVDFQTLEHNWKEFIFHFYRSRLNSLTAA